MKKLLPVLLLAACGGDDAALPPDAQPPVTFGGDRPTELMVPDELEPGETYPLVLLLHGHTITGLIQFGYYKLDDIVDRRQVFFLTPDGTISGVDGHTYWNANAGCCSHGDYSVDDVGYLSGLVEDVMAAWPIDPARVYAIGHSNGGFMSFRLGCDRADLFAAIAPFAGGASPDDDCDPSRPVSVLNIHGTNDSIIPYAGADFGEGAFPGAVESAAQWQAYNGCAATRTDGDAIDLERDLDGAETAVANADGCPDDGAVTLWTINGGSHIPDFDPSFGDQMLDWLLEHAR